MISRQSALPAGTIDARERRVNAMLVRAGIDAAQVRERADGAALCSTTQADDARAILRLAKMAITLGAVP